MLINNYRKYEIKTTKPTFPKSGFDTKAQRAIIKDGHGDHRHINHETTSRYLQEKEAVPQSGYKRTCNSGHDPWIGGWMDGWMDGWMTGWIGWMDDRMDWWLDGWMDKWMDGWMAGWMSGWIGG